MDHLAQMQMQMHQPPKTPPESRCVARAHALSAAMYQWLGMKLP
jgi:hypothetical protein